MTGFSDFESIDKGTPLESLTISALTRGKLAQYAGAIEDYNPMHLDDKVAAAGGKPSVFAHGTLIMGYVGRMVQATFAGSSVRRFGMRMLKLVWPGDVLTCRGVIVDKRIENGTHLVDADVWADNQRGETVAKGRVLAVVPVDAKKGLSKKERSAGIVFAPEPKPKASSTKSATKKATTKTAASRKKAATKKKVSKKAPAKSSKAKKKTSKVAKKKKKR